MPVSPARRAAYDILRAVETRGAFVDESLHRPAVDRLDARDRALTTEIVLGVLRRRGELDRMIERAARRPTAKIDPEALLCLRLGAYQLRRMRVPAHAAVSESVDLVKVAGKPRAAGFVNAILRRLPATNDETALRTAVPEWLYRRWSERFDETTLRAVLAHSLEPPATYVRVTTQRPDEETIARLAAEGVVLEPTDVPHAYRVAQGKVAGTAAEREGAVRIQDAGSQAVVPLLRLEPGATLLDLCAAPGGKTAQAADLLGGAAGIVACDLHPFRLRILRKLAAAPPALVALDASRPAPFRRPFDRVLVDAPCSGTGTLARNPDIKWRLQPADLADLQQRQIALLRSALACCRPGGAVVYSTCSLEPEENEAVVERVLHEESAWRVDDRLERIPGRDPGDGFFAVRLSRLEGLRASD